MVQDPGNGPPGACDPLPPQGGLLPFPRSPAGAHSTQIPGSECLPEDIFPVSDVLACGMLLEPDPYTAYTCL